MNIVSSLKNKQVNNGIFIGLLVILALGVGAWWYSNRVHPLAQVESLPLCGAMLEVPGAKTCQDAQPLETVAGHSVWKDAEGVPVLRVDMVTTHNLSLTAPMTTKVWFDSALPQIKASGREDWAEPSGSWADAVITRRGDEQELLLEDKGIVLILQSKVLGREGLLAYANKAAAALWKLDAAKVSQAGAKTK